MGPLPVWAWGVIGGILVIAYLWWTQWRHSDSSSVSGKDEPANALDLLPDQLLNPEAPQSTQQSSSFASNFTWLAQGVKLGIAMGFSPLTVEQALRAYLDGGSITSQQKLIIDAVIAQIGLPPDGTAGNVTIIPDPPPAPEKPEQPKPTTPPATPAKPAAPKTAVYVIQRGDTLSGIAKKLGISMATLKQYNPVFWTNPKYQQGNMIWSGGKVVYPIGG